MNTSTTYLPNVAALIASRKTILPKRLSAPGPTEEEVHILFEAAACAPDHGQRLPWRFIIVRDESRTKLAEVFKSNLLERDPLANESELSIAYSKAFRAPFLALCVSKTGHHDDEINPAERLISLGCAIQNILLTATELKYGSSLTSGKSLQSASLRNLFTLTHDENAVCFLNIGTIQSVPGTKTRPIVEKFLSMM